MRADTVMQIMPSAFKKNVPKLLLCLIFCSTVTAPASAQNEENRERLGPEAASFEPHFFSIDSAFVQIDILYRIRYDFFVFTYDISSPENFKGGGNLSIELLDSSEASVVRRFISLDLTTENNSSQNLREKYYEGGVSFSVHPGRYRVVYHLEDKESQREYSDSKRVILVPKFSSSRSVQSSFVFVEPVDSLKPTTVFTPYDIGDNIVFGDNAGVMFAARTGFQPAEIHYTLLRITGDDNTSEPVQRDTTLFLSYEDGMRPKLQPLDSGTVKYVPARDSTTSLAYFTVPTAHLEQGRYSAAFYFTSGDTARIRKEFFIRWVNMPFSLTDLDFAVRAMKYITTDSEYDDLQSGGRSARIKKFENFWKRRDPTPSTAYNEMMAEYFRRVDYAFSQYRTFKQENGALTDRGRIYILYGKPSSIDRTLEPGEAPKEIWTYSSLKKEFVFEDPSRQGNYRLTSTGDQ